MEKKRDRTQLHMRLQQDEQDKVNLNPGEDDSTGEDSDSNITKLMTR